MIKRLQPLLWVLAFQFTILILIPARKMAALSGGQKVVLETVPVDPYDPLSGYYVTLAYAVEQAANASPFSDGDLVYLVVRKAEPAWQFVAVQREAPAAEPDRAALLGRVEYGRVRIDGIGKFFIPETQRDTVEGALQKAGRRAFVEVKVGEDGTPAITSVRVGDRTFH